MSILVSIFLCVLAVISAVVGGFYLFFKRRYRHWEKKKVAFPTPRFPFGNLWEVGISKNAGIVFRELYEKGEGESLYGFFALHRPMLLVRDPDLVKNILVRDFMYFHDHDVYYNEEQDPLSAHLFSLEGVKWRNLRAKLTPTFTSGKMKLMFPMVMECGEELQNVLGDIAAADGVFEAKDLLARYTTDVISTCAFGIQANSLKEPNSVFREMGRKIFEPTWSVMIKNTMTFFAPDLAALIKLVVTPKDVAKFFLDAIKETMDYREQNNVKRNDFMQLLIQLKTKGFIDDVDKDKYISDKEKFTFEQAAAQAFIFFIGGFETSSSTMQFLLYELALNPDIQENLREEVLRGLSRHGGKMNYEALHGMELMTKVIDETLRKYPPAPAISRVCTKEYKIPDTDIVIEKGTSVLLPSFGLQMDPQYFPNPEKFDPERFTEEQKAERHQYTYLPFGEGPRHCIGMRFAQMQIRVAITAILSKFKIEVCKQTPIPLDMDPIAFVFLPKGGMNLKVSAL